MGFINLSMKPSTSWDRENQSLDTATGSSGKREFGVVFGASDATFQTWNTECSRLATGHQPWSARQLHRQQTKHFKDSVPALWPLNVTAQLASSADQIFSWASIPPLRTTRPDGKNLQQFTSYTWPSKSLWKNKELRASSVVIILMPSSCWVMTLENLAFSHGQRIKLKSSGSALMEWTGLNLGQSKRWLWPSSTIWAANCIAKNTTFAFNYRLSVFILCQTELTGQAPQEGAFPLHWESHKQGCT